MAKPRIFVSSTYYDLKHIRNNLESFIKDMGYDPILFESGDIPFHHDLALDESCYREIENSHMQILILGGRYGSSVSNNSSNEPSEEEKSKFYQQYNSITKREYLTARDKGIPIFMFIEKGVNSEYQTYKYNRTNESIKYAHVDSINIFKLLDEILVQRTGNFIKDFEKFDDIRYWLKEQWAGLFADYLSNKSTQLKLKNLSTEIGELKSINNALKEYTEAIMRKIKPENFNKIIEEEENRMLKSQAVRFRSEPMTRFILNKLPEKHIEISSKELFLKFKNSKDINDFLNQLDIDTTSTKIKDYVETMKKDYTRFKAKYFNEATGDVQLDEINDE